MLRRHSGLLAVLVPLLMVVGACRADVRGASPWMGANVKMAMDAPWGSPAAQTSLDALAKAGASRALLVAFVWQRAPDADDPVLGSDSSVEQMRQAVIQAKAAGLVPVLKVHVWIPGHWAGELAPKNPDAWFKAYQRAVLPLVRMAQQQHVPVLVLGTELRMLQDAPQWKGLVAAVRGAYRGKLMYVADGMASAETFRYWSLFDIIGASLYPQLPDDHVARIKKMEAAAASLKALGEREHRPVWVAELGLRSARGALGAPWESPEQRQVEVDTALQRQVLEQWRSALTASGIDGIGIWCWYTDPDAGGMRDTDFTVQNKPAQAILRTKAGG